MSNNATDSDHDIDFGEGAASVLNEDPRGLALNTSTAFTKRLDASWASGTGNGGLFSGSIAASTWYHCFLIRNDSNKSIVDFGFTTAIDPTGVLPSGYSTFRRIGSILTDGSSNIRGFSQKADVFTWDTTQRDVTSNNPGTGTTTSTMSVPPDKEFEAFLIAGYDTGTSGAATMRIHKPGNNPNNGAGLVVSDTSSSSAFEGCYLQCMTNESSQVSWTVNFSNVNTDIFLDTVGWRDTRGKN